jgi:hypothetical protein
LTMTTTMMMMMISYGGRPGTIASSAHIHLRTMFPGRGLVGKRNQE